jgi:hypothetical protein
MKKNKFTLLLISLLLSACGGNVSDSQTDISSSSSSIESDESISSSTDSSKPEKDYYAVVNSQYDTIHVYGIIGESFDLSTIDYSRCTNKKPTYKLDSSEGITIENDVLSFQQNGIYNVGAYNGNKKIYSIQIVVNDSEENRYKYPLDIDLDNYELFTGKSEYLTVVDDDSLILKSDETPWNRIGYDLLPDFSTNYTIECDISFQNSTNNERWFGIVFRDQSTSKQKYPYYQFDIRRNTSSEKAV